ncbi:hypothetical protein D0962_13345 [Leptolyngbyaceae cyanobacterium CCMR0082]|uniref:Uncharacterized protein n=2 Tax=Adonisia turfae TaxID=2950184 RepID=A0A6M0S5I9_9CYAN|nr:hypothetical protein [Adonisia turfae]MDV3353492.1 hypothetical protein [Leptothoe sp. LEGE 181152]NEZ56750.1 hypothetical protein [Adonisia turfae CCMR0081]NEZ63759.1 hypothetical protein [Adonisia turfae CCMR0082]
MKQSSPNYLLRLRLYLNLVPVLGIPASLLTLYGTPHEPDAQLKQVSRLAVVLGMGWLLATVLLSAGAHSEFSQLATLRFWIASSFVGSGYFLTNLWLMLRIFQGKSTKLPGVSQLSRRLPD